MISTIIIILLLILVVILGFTTFNLLRKNEKAEDIIIEYEKYIRNVGQNIEFIDKRLTEIDTKGSFKSDDEVGFFFERVKLLNDMLKPFKIRL